MDDLKCSLLGFDSAAFAAPPRNDALSPMEASIVGGVLGLGTMYVTLYDVVRQVSLGRTTGLYACAVSAGIDSILQHYRAAVKALDTPSSLLTLRGTYELTFSKLVEIVKPAAESRGTTMSAAAGAALLTAAQSFMANQELPAPFRAMMGESVWLSLLYTVAHYVAHGVVLHGRTDFFVSFSTRSSSNALQEEHTLHQDLLPAVISTELGLLVLAAGRERRLLLSDARPRGADYLDELALSTQDEAADAVFRAIFHPALCVDGTLVVDALEARVRAAKELWSKTLWSKVGAATALASQLTALQETFLCHRGDVWRGFMERVLPVLLAALLPASSERTAGAGHQAVAVISVTALRRVVTEAFANALAQSGLQEAATPSAGGGVYEAFRMELRAAGGHEDEAGVAALLAGESKDEEANATQSVEDVAATLLKLVSCMELHYTVPRGVHFVVSTKALAYYQRLHAFYLRMQSACYAMQLTRQCFVEAIVTNRKPSADLRVAFGLYQLCQFLLTSLLNYIQIDVVEQHAMELKRDMQNCRSVEEAKRRHDCLVWRVAEGSFLTDGAEAVLQACEALFANAMTLHVLSTRYRLNYWAVEGVNETPLEVTAALHALHTRLQQQVMAVFNAHLGVASRSAERALWVRLDFNRYVSQGARRAGVIVGPRLHLAEPVTLTEQWRAGTGGSGGGGGKDIVASTAAPSPSLLRPRYVDANTPTGKPASTTVVTAPCLSAAHGRAAPTPHEGRGKAAAPLPRTTLGSSGTAAVTPPSLHVTLGPLGDLVSSRLGRSEVRPLTTDGASVPRKRSHSLSSSTKTATRSRSSGSRRRGSHEGKSQSSSTTEQQ